MTFKKSFKEGESVMQIFRGRSRGKTQFDFHCHGITVAEPGEPVRDEEWSRKVCWWPGPGSSLGVSSVQILGIAHWFGEEACTHT